MHSYKAGTVRALCLLLTAALLAAVFFPPLKTGVHAAQAVPDRTAEAYAGSLSVRVKYVQAYFSALDCRNMIRLLEKDGTVCIEAEDLAAAAKMQVEDLARSGGRTGQSRGRLRFTRAGSVFSCTVPSRSILEYDDGLYVPLPDTAKLLHVRYMYDEVNHTLVLNHTEYLEEDLIQYAKEILGEDSSSSFPRYFLGDIAGTVDGAVASAFNVLIEKGIFRGLASLALGTYGKEKYAKAVSAILTAEDGGLSAELEKDLEQINKGLKNYADIVSTADRLTENLENDLEAQGVNLFEQFGEYALTFGFDMSDTDRILKAFYDLKVFGPSDFLSLYHRMTLREQSEMLYVRAFNRGLGENGFIDERELQWAVDDVYPFTKDAETESRDSLSWVVKRVAENLGGVLLNSADEAVMKAFTEEFSSGLFDETGLTIKGILTKLVKQAVLNYSRTKKRTDAVEQTYLLSRIQDCAAAQIRSHSYPSSDDYDPVTVKYSLILYLRAAFVGYRNYEFEDDLLPYVRQAENALSKHILHAALWQDDLIAVCGDDEEGALSPCPDLDLTLEGFYDSMDGQAVLTRREQNFADLVISAACAYLYTQGEDCSVWSFDFDGNGARDLLVRKDSAPLSVLAVSGSCPYRAQTCLASSAVPCEVFAYSDLPGEIKPVVCYVDELGDMVYSPFSGRLEAPVIKEVPPSEMTDYERYWAVNECLYTEEEYVRYGFDGILLDAGDCLISDAFRFSAGMPEGFPGRFSGAFSAVSGVKQTQTADINGDGVRDLVIRFAWHTPEVILDGVPSEDAPAQMEEYGCPPFGVPDAGAVIMSSGDMVDVQILSWEDALLLSAQAAGTGNTATDDPAADGQSAEGAKTLSDGVHPVVFYRSLLEETASGGYLATVYELACVTYEDSVIRNLRPGDRVGDVTVNTIEWYGDSSVNINSFALMLNRLDDGLWYQTMENDILVTVETDPFILEIPAGVPAFAFLESPWDEEEVKDLETLLSYGYDEKEELQVWVENGEIVRIVREYRP